MKGAIALSPPAFRVFVKLADRPAPMLCELQVLRLEIAPDGDSLAYFDVAPNHAYETVLRPAVQAELTLQIGVEFVDSRRILLTGRAQIQPPTVIGMQVLERVRMLVQRAVPASVAR